jgi:hypothetical protein
MPSVAALMSRAPVPAQDRDLPAGDGAGGPFEFRHFAGAVVIEDDQPPAGVESEVGEVSLAQKFVGEVGGAGFASGVAGIQQARTRAKLAASSR